MRYLVRGYPLGKIAAHLGISRHSITRWKHDEHFVAAMEQLRREMTDAIISPAAKASPPPRAMDPLASWMQTNARLPRNDDDDGDDEDDDLEHDDNDDEDEDEEMSDEEAAETEAWIEQVIAASRTGGKIPPPPPPRASL